MNESFEERIRRFLSLHSTTALHQLHESIASGLAKEDGPPTEAERTHRFRRFEDFRIEAGAIEAELKKRGEPFTPIAW